MKRYLIPLVSLCAPACGSSPGATDDAPDVIETSDTGTDSGDAFVATDVAVEEDIVVAQDTAAVEDAGFELSENPCEGPPRIVSYEVHTAVGGSHVVAEGMEYWIGALEWMLYIESAEQYVFMDYAYPYMDTCRIAWELPALAAGAHDLLVFYGWESESPPENVESDRMVRGTIEVIAP